MLLELVLLLITLAIAYALFINRVRGLPPGPPPLPLLGNTLALGDPIDQVMLRWSKQYGPVFTAWLPAPTVVIADYKSLQESVVKQGDLFGDRSVPSVQMKMLVDGEYGLVFNGNYMWKEQRRFALHSLKDVGFLSESLQESVKSYSQHIVSDWKKDGADGKEIDVTHNIMYGVANLIWLLAFGRTVQFGDPKLKVVKDEVNKLFVAFVHPCVPFLEYFPYIGILDPLFGYPIRNMKEVSDSCMDIVRKELDITEKALNYDEDPRCYADSFFIEMRRREEKGEPMGNFTRDQLAVAALDMWTAGFETTVTTLRFAIHHLMSRPEIQRKMQKEIDQQIGQRQISMEDQKALPYCMAAILEIQRLANIVEMNFYRETNQDTVIGGFRIPAKTAILPQFPSVHVDPKNFERPDYFCPERHINDAGEFMKDPRIMPFSLGKRQCLGEGLARMELFIFLTTFVQHCSFSSPTLIPPEIKLIRGITRSPELYTVKITARF
ncbi:hypothetical protein PFISCL1PPCAC_13255 [Pristionchus fissidentatus]|uniref:Cytochrome P450 n=1 Tax=Pristionchus fissidentatus TaxID=1538716 RepID=A0AAV5VUK8_9BILA|nr:hypothetical protein PFISCL1PPCAC_13255 [Pristionchus fissidentatus]